MRKKMNKYQNEKLTHGGSDFPPIATAISLLVSLSMLRHNLDMPM